MIVIYWKSYLETSFEKKNLFFLLTKTQIYWKSYPA